MVCFGCLRNELLLSGHAFSAMYHQVATCLERDFANAISKGVQQLKRDAGFCVMPKFH